VARLGKLLTKIAAFTVASLAYGPAMASTFLGEIPVGYSDNLFQIGQGTSSLVININAIGTRDPAICAFCNSAYTDNFTVNLFDQTGTLLKSANATNYLYYNMYSSSHGIGAGPVGFVVPAGATTLEIVTAKKEKAPKKSPTSEWQQGPCEATKSGHGGSRRPATTSQDVADSGMSPRGHPRLWAQKGPMAIRVSVAASGAAHREVRDLRQALRRTQGRRGDR